MLLSKQSALQCNCDCDFDSKRSAEIDSASHSDTLAKDTQLHSECTPLKLQSSRITKPTATMQTPADSFANASLLCSQTQSLSLSQCLSGAETLFAPFSSRASEQAVNSVVVVVVSFIQSQATRPSERASLLANACAKQPNDSKEADPLAS